jgi:hypothetical protein
MTDKNYQLIEKDNFIIILIKNEALRPICVQIIDDLKRHTSPRHIIVNCLLISKVDEFFFESFNCLKYILTENQKTLTYTYVSEQIKDILDQETLENTPIKIGIGESLKLFNQNIFYPPLNFLKSIVGKTINELFYNYKFPAIREKVFIKENSDNFKGNEFLGDVTSTNLLVSDKFFFHIAFTFSQNSLDYLKDINLLTFTKDLTKNILQGFEKLNISLDESYGTELTKKEIPATQFNFKEESITLFELGTTVVIPLTCTDGNAYIETWIPKRFESYVLKAINSLPC